MACILWLKTLHKNRKILGKGILNLEQGYQKSVPADKKGGKIRNYTLPSCYGPDLVYKFQKIHWRELKLLNGNLYKTCNSRTEKYIHVFQMIMYKFGVLCLMEA